MTEQTDSSLAAYFEQDQASALDDAFTASVMQRATRQRRLALYVRVALGVGLAVCLAPMQEIALNSAEILMTSIVNIDHPLVAAFLAPINCVAGILSGVLLTLRTLHGRLISG